MLFFCSVVEFIADHRRRFRTHQALLQADKQLMSGGTTLDNGFGIFTLLYQHARIFGKYAASESEWNANRDRLGFSEFAYQGEDTYGG